MVFVDDVGEVSTGGGSTIRWTIPQYLHTPREVDTVFHSPKFTFRGEDQCWLEAYPSGFNVNQTEGWFGIGCVIPYLPPGFSVRCSMAGSDGQETLHMGMTQDRYSPWYCQYKWIQQAELVDQSQLLLPGGQLRLIFRVDRSNRRGQSEEEAESGAEAAATNLDANSNKTNNSHCSEGVHNLIQNLKDLYVQGVDCDFTIRIGGREFRTHRLLLKARVPTFSAMLTHDMAENRDGVVDVKDCDPDIFNEFLLFIYSGRVDNLNPDNMCGLYVLGDKYGLPDLKKICIDFIKSSLTVRTICDVISLASTHNEAGLLNLATEFFVNNSEEILLTVEWQVFIEKNPTKSNELFLKTVKFFKTKLQNSTH